MNIGATVTVDRIRRVFALTSVGIVFALIVSAVAGLGFRLADGMFVLILMTFIYWRITRWASEPTVDRRTRQREVAAHLDRRSGIDS